MFLYYCDSSNLTKSYRIIFFCFSTMVEQILVVQLVGHLLPQVMTMMHLLMNMVGLFFYFDLLNPGSASWFYIVSWTIIGLPRLPKWGHLKELHKAIKLTERVVLNSEPSYISLGPSLEVMFFHAAWFLFPFFVIIFC